MAARAAASSSLPSLAPDTPAPDGNPRFSPHRSPSPPTLHRRGYQACDPCRKRKVKCDLGSVDNPRPPPCVRCRRESKRCEFSATRRKRKASEVDENRDGRDDVLRRDMRMMSADGSRVEASNNNHDAHDATPALAPPSAYPPAPVDTMPLPQRKWSEPSMPSNRMHTSSISQIRGSQPPMSATSSYQSHRPSGLSSFSDGRGLAPPHALPSGEHMMNKTAADLLSPAISNTHDALHLLSEAAGRTEDFNRQQLEYRYSGPKSTSSTFTSSNSPMGQASTPGKSSGPTSAVQKGASMGWYHHDTGVTNADNVVPKVPEDVDYANARRAWSRLRFIRAGWFTVDEAMAYIAYYYEHLAPLSPIVLPDFSPPPTHLKLLTEEPVLTVTMLTIASRHMELTGNGANSRAYSIHEKLWSYLRGMIERLFWGQEKFGGGSVPPGRTKAWEFGLTPGQASVNGLRSLGTVEALLLLTDWHPRALYFPPGDDENTLLDADPQLLAQLSGNKEDENDTDNAGAKNQGGSAEGRLAFYKWLEPVWRSDRMSWMLLSTAQALAFELGVFDEKGDPKRSAEFSPEQVRKRRVKRLILVYISQSSGRLGIPSMLPLPQWNQHTDLVSTDDLTTPMDPNEGRAIDLMHDCWMDISKIMYTSNQVLFLSKEQTSNLIKTGRYRERIEEFLPALRDFRRKFDRISLSVHMRHILSIEYEYSRLYINSLALQAVVDKWTTISNDEAARNAAQNGAGKSDPGQSSSGTAPLRVLMEQYQVNEPFIQEVVDASRKILRIVLDGLVPGNYLKHAPVRTYFRVLSGMIFILKTFTLGAREDDVRISLELQDRTIECLRTCVVDDVHLSVTIADLLQLLTSNIRTRFLRFAPSERPGEAASREPTPQVTSQRNSPRPQEQTQDYSSSKWGQSHLPHGSSGFQFDSNTNHTHAPTPVSTQNDPLANIPAQPINSSNLNVSFMPPPASVYYNYYDPSTASLKMDNMDDNSTISPQALSNNAGAGASSSNTLSDWFALPLDQFFNSSVADVDQGLGGTGPMVGEFDMLEVLLKEQHHDDAGGGAGGGGASGGNLSAQFF